MSLRIRQHVNPLSAKFQHVIPLPNLADIYDNLQQPLHLDLGSARGTFLLEMAQLNPHWNFLGTEIREALVNEANDRRQTLNLTNLHYLFCNVNLTLKPLLQTLPPGVLRYVTLQFPDPWFKKRHHKRRVMQPNLVDTLAQGMPPGSTLFLQSDVEEIMVDMVTQVEAQGDFARQGQDWLPQNPLPVSTERERATQRKGQPVYRALFQRR